MDAIVATALCKPESEWNLTPGSPAKLTKHEHMSRKKEAPPRYCMVCGEYIPRAGTVYSNYIKRIYCSVACQRKGQFTGKSRIITPDTKTCPTCGTQFHRFDGQSMLEWAHRRYCSVDCRKADRLKDGEAVCACGRPTSARVYFVQARANGTTTPTWLDVCDDCRDYMLEDDPGCSASPIMPTVGRLWRSEDDEEPLPYQPPHGGIANRRTYHD